MPNLPRVNGWHVHRFDEMATMVNDRVDDPSGSEVDYYVGLEHLDPESLTIRRWGLPEEVEATKLRFRVGDIIFGRRRVYQRKLAIAHFDGICSAHAMVLRAKPAVALPEFLPFFMQSDLFMERAKEISVGSLSPTINWKTLAKEEFALPPLNEQRQIAAALSAVQTVEDQLFASMASCDLLFASCLEKCMCAPNAKTVALRDIATVERGKFTHRPRNLPEFYGGDAEFVQTGDVASSRGILGPASQTLSELGKTYSRSFPPGTVLVTIAAVIGATAVATREVWFPDSIVGVCPDERLVEPAYVELALRRLRPLLETHEATASTQKNINLATLRPLRIPLFPLDVQKHIVDELGQIEQARVAMQARRAALYGLRQSMLAGRGPAQ